jgi:hypothetical protein
MVAASKTLGIGVQEGRACALDSFITVSISIMYVFPVLPVQSK